MHRYGDIGVLERYYVRNPFANIQTSCTHKYFSYECEQTLVSKKA